MNKDKIMKLGDLLPEDISEDTLGKITNLVGDVINDEVVQRIKLLEAKTLAFIRGNIELFKEQALNELKEENPVYQDALQYRKIKKLMGVTKTQISEVKETKEVTELAQENTILIEQFNSLVEAYTELETKYKKARRGYKTLKEQSTSLTEQVDILKDENKPFKSSERALVISEEVENSATTQIKVIDNEFLTKDVMALMPNK